MCSQATDVNLATPIIVISVYNVAGRNCSEKFTTLSISIWPLPYLWATSLLALEFDWLLQTRYSMGDQLADVISCLDSALSAMNFLDHMYFVLLQSIYNACKILQYE